MLLLKDINSFLLLILFLTRTIMITNQDFITIINDSRAKYNKFLYLFDKKIVILSVNLTSRKHFGLNNYLTDLLVSKSLSRKRREPNHESLKYFTCAMVSMWLRFL
jgi:hypothetical protein